MEGNIRHYCTPVAQKKGNIELGRWILVRAEATLFALIVSPSRMYPVARAHASEGKTEAFSKRRRSPRRDKTVGKTRDEVLSRNELAWSARIAGLIPPMPHSRHTRRDP